MRASARHLGILLLTALVVSGAGLLAAMAMTWAAGSEFTPWGNYISELSVGPSGAPAAFVIMIVGLAVCCGAFFVLAPGPVRTELGGNVRAAHIGLVCGAVANLALLLMVFFPLDPGRQSSYTVHLVLAATAFAFTGGEVAAYARVLENQTGLLGWARTVAFLCAPGTFVFGVLVVLVELLGVVSRSPIVFAIEWLAFTLFAGWMILMGIGLVRRSARPR